MVSSQTTESNPRMVLRTELWSSTRGATIVNQELSQPVSPYFQNKLILPFTPKIKFRNFLNIPYCTMKSNSPPISENQDLSLRNIFHAANRHVKIHRFHFSHCSMIPKTAKEKKMFSQWPEKSPILSVHKSMRKINIIIRKKFLSQIIKEFWIPSQNLC